jgi:glycosyltransferase involved in cell wall biosynthesis
VACGGRDAVRQAAHDADLLLVSGPAEFGDWVAGLRRPPTIFVAHGDSQWTLDILDSVGSAIDEVVAVSHRVKNAIGDRYPTTVIHNAIDPAHLVASQSRNDARQSLGFRKGDFVLGYVGRFSPEKNPFALIAAVERLPSSFKLLMVGFGPLRADILDQAARRIPGRCVVVEATDQLGDYYQAMDALCLPSYTEGYGLVSMEAMYCGCPVISAPVGFAPESLTDGVNGIIVDGSPASFARAAVQLHEHPRWRRCVANEARRYANEYGMPRRMASKYEQSLARIYDKYRVRP